MHGNFNSLEELDRVPGIGAGVLRRLRPFLSVRSDEVVVVDDNVVCSGGSSYVGSVNGRSSTTSGSSHGKVHIT